MQDAWRWRSVHEASAQAIIRYFVESLQSRDELTTRLARLAIEVGLDLADVRFGIAALIDDGDFALLDARDRQPVAPETVEEVRSVVVKVDWDKFANDRIHLQSAVPTGEA